MVVSWATIRSAICWCLLFLIIPIGAVSPAPMKQHQVVSGKITMPEETATLPDAQTDSAEAGAKDPATSVETDSGGQAEGSSPPLQKSIDDPKPARSVGDPSPTPQRVRQSIVLPKQDKALPKPSAPLPSASGPDTSIAPKPLSPVPGTTAPAPRADVSEPAGDKSPPLSTPLTSLLSADRDKLKNSYTYNPAGKIDPFEPLLRAKPEAVKRKAKKQRPKRIPRTPLEMVDISQLTLSAIISASSGNRALVEEASGKGYVVREGTPIGIHWGKVAAIKRDRVVVEEEVEDLMGNYVKRKREMKLNKPIGE